MIMSQLNISVVESFDVFGDGDLIEMEEQVYHQILLVGDQLTVARALGSDAIRAHHVTHTSVQEQIAWKGFCLLLKIGMLSNVCLRYYILTMLLILRKPTKLSLYYGSLGNYK